MPPSVVIWEKPPPVMGTVAIPGPVVLSKATTCPLAVVSGRLSTAPPQVTEGQIVVIRPVVVLSRSMSPVVPGAPVSLLKTTGPLAPGKAACADGATATAAKPAMVPVARSVPKRPRHLLLSVDTLLIPPFVVGDAHRSLPCPSPYRPPPPGPTR